jgi:hypothetical protein
MEPQNLTCKRFRPKTLGSVSFIICQAASRQAAQHPRQSLPTCLGPVFVITTQSLEGEGRAGKFQISLVS